MRRWNLTLEDILNTMDLPSERVNLATAPNAQWLLRNMGIRNANNTGYLLALSILQRELHSLTHLNTADIAARDKKVAALVASYKKNWLAGEKSDRDFRVEVFKLYEEES